MSAATCIPAQIETEIATALRRRKQVYLDFRERRVSVVLVYPGGLVKVAYGRGNVGLVRLPDDAELHAGETRGSLVVRVRREEVV